jgi:hypothetical protein
MNVVVPKDKNELAFYSITQLASLIKNKKITSVELTTFFLNRLKKWGDTLECVITLTEELAMQQAKAADAELKKGIYRGPLHGIPYGLKDLFAVKGYKTTWGTTPYKDQVIDEDSYIYTKLKMQVLFYVPNFLSAHWHLTTGGLVASPVIHGTCNKVLADHLREVLHR